MREVLSFVRKVAISEATTILLEGENGTGKDLIAKTLHYQSPRQAEPFIAINCAAIPETLLESELFGYEKGAFTDARAQKRGMFELADKGHAVPGRNRRDPADAAGQAAAGAGGADVSAGWAG